MSELRRVIASAGILAILLAGCGGPAKPGTGGGAGTGTGAGTDTTGPVEPEPSKPAELAYRTLDKDTTIRTSSGASTVVPAGWHLAERDDVVYCVEPERELSVMLTAFEGGDTLGAIKRAWDKVEPGFDLATADDTVVPARDGWDEVRQITYVTPSAEGRIVIAIARQKGTTFHVALLDGKAAALGRRGAQATAIVLDMKVPGITKESLAGKPVDVSADKLKTWDAFVEEVRVATGIPGVAVAVVHGGKIIFEAGHGVKQVGAKGKVAPATLFMIGSITKSITTLLIAALVDKGTVKWEQPVVEVLPTFALADAEITKQVTMRHTGCACTGLPRQDFEMVFEYGGWTPEQRMASLAAMKPTTGFGETFQYSNLMVALGGYAAAHAYAPKLKLGPAYAKAMTDLILKPLGMKTATLDRKKAIKGGAAHPHARGVSKTFAAVPVEYESFVDPVAPAGALWASVRDMAQFMMFELAKGKNAKGKQVITEANVVARRAPQVAISETDAYGIGLVVGQLYGLPILHHNGGTAGFNTDMLILPEQDLGLIILTNSNDAGLLIGTVRRRFFELTMGAEERAAKEITEEIAKADLALGEELALHAAPDDAWVTPLLGTYTEPSLGTITLKKTKQGKVILDAGEWTSEIAKKTDRDGTVKVITITGAFATLELIPRVTDGAQTLVLDAGQQVYTFAPAPKK